MILDELNIVLRYDTLPLGEVLDALAGTARRTCTSWSPAATPSPS